MSALYKQSKLLKKKKKLDHLQNCTLKKKEQVSFNHFLFFLDLKVKGYVCYILSIFFLETCKNTFYGIMNCNVWQNEHQTCL